ARLRVEGDPPTVLLHDPLADGESQARPLPLALGGEERLEHVRGDFLRHSRPRVRDTHGDAVALRLRGHPDPATRGVAGDGLVRIIDEVHEHLLDLIAVHFDVGQPRLHLEGGLDLVRHQLVAQQRQRRLEDRADRLSLALALLAAGERQQVLDDRGCPLGLLTDDLQRLGELRGDVPERGEDVRDPHHRGQGRPGMAVTGTWMSSAKTRLPRRTVPWASIMQMAWVMASTVFSHSRFAEERSSTSRAFSRAMAAWASTAVTSVSSALPKAPARSLASETAPTARPAATSGAPSHDRGGSSVRSAPRRRASSFTLRAKARGPRRSASCSSGSYVRAGTALVSWVTASWFVSASSRTTVRRSGFRSSWRVRV